MTTPTIHPIGYVCPDGWRRTFAGWVRERMDEAGIRVRDHDGNEGLQPRSAAADPSPVYARMTRHGCDSCES